jgi:large subunit ribosomal protein L25
MTRAPAAMMAGYQSETFRHFVMAKKHTLKAELRARTGSGLLKQMRREGWVPSVIYGKGAANKNLKVDAKAFRELLGASESENILINLEIAGAGADLAFLQAIQYDPLNGEALHADFRAVDEKTEIHASVPVHLLGAPVGVKAGGILEQSLHTLDVVCAVTNLPEFLEFDVSGLGEHESLHIGDVRFPEGVRPDYPAEVVIAHIGRPGSASSEEGEQTEEGGAAAPVAAAPAEA